MSLDLGLTLQGILFVVAAVGLYVWADKVRMSLLDQHKFKSASLACFVAAFVSAFSAIWTAGLT